MPIFNTELIAIFKTLDLRLATPKRRNIILGLALCGMVSCTPEFEPSLNKEDRKLLDSLYSKAVPVLKAEMDSLCILETKKILDVAVDSIIEVRLEERKKRLGY